MPNIPRKTVADNAFLQAALWYAGRGIPVFPLQSRGKKPLTEHGFKDATTHEATIRAWWEKWPHANIGVPMGAASSLLLLDLDFRNGSVVESRDELIEQFGPIPETAEVKTGSGGRHIYFKFSGIEVPTEIAKGVELKGEGGYAVVPPSIHPNGTEYTFDGLIGRNAILKAADPPAWLLNAIIESLKPRGRKPAATDAEKFPEGSQNNSLTSLAGKLRRDGLSGAGLEAALLEENLARCSPPLDDAEVRKIAASIAKYPAGESAHRETVEIDVGGVTPTIEMLNQVALFEGRIKFAKLWRTGPMIQAGFADGRRAHWRGANDLRTFSRSQDILFDATGFLMRTPGNKSIRRIWETIARIIRSIADQNATDLEPPLQDEFAQVIRSTWEKAERPETTTGPNLTKCSNRASSKGGIMSPVRRSAASGSARDRYGFISQRLRTG